MLTLPANQETKNINEQDTLTFKYNEGVARKEKPEKLEVTYGVRVSEATAAEINALAAAWDMLPSSVARRLLKRGLAEAHSENDPHLERIKELWPELPEDVRVRLARLFESARAH